MSKGRNSTRVTVRLPDNVLEAPKATALIDVNMAEATFIFGVTPYAGIIPAIWQTGWDLGMIDKQTFSETPIHDLTHQNLFTFGR